MSTAQLKDGRWICYFRKGRDLERPNSTRRYFGRDAAGRSAAAAFDKKLKDRRKTLKNPGGLNFSELAAMYLTAKISTMSDTDQDNTYTKLQRVINPRIGHVPAAGLDHFRLDSYVASRMQDTVKVGLGSSKKKDTGRRISTSTIHRELSIVRAILNWGVKRKIMIASSMAAYEMPKRDDKKILPPTEEEFSAILQAAAPHCQRMILTSYYTGLRPGKEAYRLTWNNVDLDKGTITVISAKKGGIAARVVPIHPTLHDYLVKWKQEDADHLGYLIHWHNRPIKTSMKNAWAAAKKRAGITRDLRPYSLRHKAISDMLAAGGDVGAVAELVGHADPQMTLKVYQQTNTVIKKAAIAGLGNTENVLPKKKNV